MFEIYIKKKKVDFEYNSIKAIETAKKLAQKHDRVTVRDGSRIIWSS